ncbi:MAG: hypothetical protein KJ060_15035 [Candidatus Hydrogenedentes bacterium]|nr:hypothetical protein [Candidatus Hydrogenedentota bacterium]
MHSAREKRILLLRLSLWLVVGFLTTSLLSYFVSRESLRKHMTSTALPLTSDNVYSEIRRDLLEPILISSLMAEDTFLRDWMLAGEHDAGDIAKYLTQIRTKYDLFSTFLVSESTRAYYYGDGVLKHVHPDEERDEWFFRVREMATDYEINIDPDMANRDAMTIFINHKVYDYDRNFIGATGVGLTTNAVSGLMEDYREKYGSEIFLAARDGTVTIASESLMSRGDNIHAMEGLSSIAGEMLTTERATLRYRRNGDTIHVFTRFVPELDLYLVVEKAEIGIVRNIYATLLLNVALCATITAIAIALTIVSINVYQKITKKQQQEILARHRELIEQNEKLEGARAHVRTLQGVLPICMHCHKIRTDEESWQRLETYIEAHSDAAVSHGLCPDCLAKHYPEYRNP